MALVNEKSRTTYFSQCTRCLQVEQERFFFSIFEGHKSFLWGHWYRCFGLLVTPPVGLKPGAACYMLPDIHLWCNTCQPLGSQVILFHIPVSRHWGGSKPGSIMLPGRRCTTWAMPAWLSRNDFIYFCLSQHFLLNHTDLSFLAPLPKL